MKKGINETYTLDTVVQSALYILSSNMSLTFTGFTGYILPVNRISIQKKRIFFKEKFKEKRVYGKSSKVSYLASNGQKKRCREV